MITYCHSTFDKEIDDICNFMKSGEQIAYGNHAIIAERKLADYIGMKYSLLVNSGSSANMLAFMALTSYKLGKRKINRGDEIITTACGFPTTISPIVNYGCIPVFVDIDDTLNIDVNQLEKAISKRTKAIIIAHTLGNPFDIKAVKEFCNKHNLWLIEDNCDALSSEYMGQKTGSFGDISTSSFYPAHHITCGEGGAVYTNNLELYRIIQSMRDWGRDYKCITCRSVCENRFANNYDCRYTYSHFGFNLKVTELQAILLERQIEKIDEFAQKRKQNWKILRDNLDSEKIKFQIKQKDSDPSWFVFYMEIENRNEFVKYLELNGIGSRVIFAGNILKHDCMIDVKYRQIGDLKKTNEVMNNGCFIGCYQGIGEKEIKYITKTIKDYLCTQ